MKAFFLACRWISFVVHHTGLFVVHYMGQGRALGSFMGALIQFIGFPSGSENKESSCNAGGLSSILG